jgi:hypothetical protein
MNGNNSLLPLQLCFSACFQSSPELLNTSMIRKIPWQKNTQVRCNLKSMCTIPISYIGTFVNYEIQWVKQKQEYGHAVLMDEYVMAISQNPIEHINEINNFIYEFNDFQSAFFNIDELFTCKFLNQLYVGVEEEKFCFQIYAKVIIQDDCGKKRLNKIYDHSIGYVLLCKENDKGKLFIFAISKTMISTIPTSMNGYLYLKEDPLVSKHDIFSRPVSLLSIEVVPEFPQYHPSSPQYHPSSPPSFPHELKKLRIEDIYDNRHHVVPSDVVMFDKSIEQLADSNIPTPTKGWKPTYNGNPIHLRLLTQEDLITPIYLGTTKEFAFKQDYTIKVNWKCKTNYGELGYALLICEYENNHYAIARSVMQKTKWNEEFSFHEFKLLFDIQRNRFDALIALRTSMLHEIPRITFPTRIHDDMEDKAFFCEMFDEFFMSNTSEEKLYIALFLLNSIPATVRTQRLQDLRIILENTEHAALGHNSLLL